MPHALVHFLRTGAWLMIVAGSLAPSAFAVSSDGYTLRGKWEQGGLLIGRTDPAAEVSFDGRKLRVTPQGDFIFGLDRDAKPEATLSLQLPGHAAKLAHFKVTPRTWKIQRIQGLPPDKVTPPPEVEQRIEREYKLIDAAHSRDTERGNFSEAFRWPVKGEKSGVFGSQRVLNGQKKQPHFGVDVAVPTGTPVHAPAGGIVSLAEPDFYFTGGTLIIDHGHGLSSIMVHLSKLRVKPGDEVKQGDVVAESGMTGRATGPHLHWGIYWFGAHIDPEAVLAVGAAPR